MTEQKPPAPPDGGGSGERARDAHGGDSPSGNAHARDPHLAHHFDSSEQQYESGKLGMWLFLATEILLFGGLFCAYAVYRSNHPEIFIYAHRFLDKTLGGINTLILIASSFTMAWAVRAAQLGQRRKLLTLLSITLLCAFGFLGIKAVEYDQKWKHGLLWGARYKPVAHGLAIHPAGSGTIPGSAPVGSERAALDVAMESAPLAPATPSGPPSAPPPGTLASPSRAPALAPAPRLRPPRRSVPRRQPRDREIPPGPGRGRTGRSRRPAEGRNGSSHLPR